VTERLYYTDSYLTEFEAVLLEVSAAGHLYFDRTAFYPTSGGQACDFGSLCVLDGEAQYDSGAQRDGGLKFANLEVTAVHDDGDRIAHVTRPQTGLALTAGLKLRGRIEWQRRFDHMQQHSGQHLLSAVFQSQLGLSTESVHFGTESSTLDLDLGSGSGSSGRGSGTGASTLSAEDCARVVRRANRIITENRPLSVSMEASEQATALRKPSARAGELRIISIADLDRSACGGTHVRFTGEIGSIALRKIERVRQGVRVEFLCGARASERASRDYELLARAGASLSTAIDDVPVQVQTKLDELKAQEARLRQTQAHLVRYRARELYDATPADADGCKRHLERTLPLSESREIGLEFTNSPRSLFAAISAPLTLQLTVSEDSGVHAGQWLKGALATGGGRGGGSARAAQGTFAEPEALFSALRALGFSVEPAP
jgi:alanyl-tRNA synthetase